MDQQHPTPMGPPHLRPPTGPPGPRPAAPSNRPDRRRNREMTDCSVHSGPPGALRGVPVVGHARLSRVPPIAGHTAAQRPRLRRPRCVARERVTTHPECLERREASARSSTSASSRQAGVGEHLSGFSGTAERGVEPAQCGGRPGRWSTQCGTRRDEAGQRLRADQQTQPSRRAWTTPPEPWNPEPTRRYSRAVYLPGSRKPPSVTPQGVRQQTDGPS